VALPLVVLILVVHMLNCLLLYMSILEGDTTLMYLQRLTLYWHIPVRCLDTPPRAWYGQPPLDHPGSYQPRARAHSVASTGRPSVPFLQNKRPALIQQCRFPMS
jgi:hypothetical protein